MKTIIVGAPTFCDATNEFIGCLAELSRKKYSFAGWLA